VIPLLVLWLLAAPFLTFSFEPSVSRPEPSAQVRAALRYHGTLAAFEIEPGKWRFVRQGQQCKLFTNSFKKKLRELKLD